VRIIIGFAAGGGNDLIVRVLAPRLGEALGQPVIVDNRPAASGIVGTDTVAKAPPDGHTLLMVASTHTVIPATNAKLPYDADKDFAPVAMIGRNPFLFIVNAQVPAKTLGEFIALAKASPGKLNYATVGAASQSHLVTELFSQRAGIKMQHIPYRGGAPAILATVQGDTEFTIISPLASLPHIQSGALRAIAAGKHVYLEKPIARTLEDAEARARLSEALGRPLPENFAEVTIMQSDQLVTAQRTVQLLDALVIILPILTLLLLIAAIAVSPNRRRTILQIGIGLAISMLVVLLLIKLIENRVTSAVTAQPGAGVISPALDALLGGLLQWLIILLIGGILVAIIAFFADKGHWFAAAWRWLRETYTNLRERFGGTPAPTSNA
jgi:hypothetical protein